MIISNNVGRYWRRYYTKPQSLSFLEPLLYLTTWVVVTGAVIILNSDCFRYRKVQVGKDQEKAQSEKDSHSKNRGGKKTKLTIRYLYQLRPQGAVIILNNKIGRYWSLYYTKHHCWS